MVQETGRKLKIGILLDGFVLPAWKYSIIERLTNVDFAEIVLVMKCPLFFSSRSNWQRSVPGAVIKIIEKADRLIFRTRKDYLAPKDATGILKVVRQINLKYGNQGDRRILIPDQVSEIKDVSPDLILKFSVNCQDKDISKIPKYGVWEYSADNAGTAYPTIPGFREVMEKISVTRSRLLALTGDREVPVIIFSSFESTCRYSVNINRNNIAWR